jgi:hypothetical protein
MGLDAVTGQLVWKARFEGRLRSSPSYAHAIEVSPDGSSVFVTGWNDTCDAGDVATLSYRA